MAEGQGTLAATNIPVSEMTQGQPPRSMGEFNPGLSADTEAAMKQLEATINAGLAGKPVPPIATPTQAQVQIEPPPAPPSPYQPPPTPQAPAPAAPPQGVPQKFLRPDGTVDETRVAKSMTNVNDAIEQYKAKERELSQLRQQQAIQAQGFQVPPPAYPYGPGMMAPPYGQPPPGYPYMTPAPQNPYFDPDAALRARIQADLQVDPAGTLIRLHQAAIEVSKQNSAQADQDIRRNMELQDIARQDPGALTPEAMAELFKVRASMPHLDASPTPWRDAYLMRKGMYGPFGEAPASQPQAPQAARRPAAPIIGGGQAPTAPANIAPVPTTVGELSESLRQSFGHLPDGKRQEAEMKYLEQVFKRAEQSA